MMHWISLLFHNWKAKLGALALATALWLVIRHSIRYPAPSTPSPSYPATDATPRK